MATKLSYLITRAVIILTALLFSQFPAFENSYSQRLAGHLDELRYQVELMQEVAKRSGKTLDEFIGKFIASSDEDFQRQGQLMHGEKVRLIAMENAVFNFENASPFTRPFVFALNTDPVIVKAAFKQFRVSLPLTLEGLIWAVIGAFVGYLIMLIFANFFRRIRFKKKNKTVNVYPVVVKNGIEKNTL